MTDVEHQDGTNLTLDQIIEGAQVKERATSVETKGENDTLKDSVERTIAKSLGGTGVVDSMRNLPDGDFELKVTIRIKRK